MFQKDRGPALSPTNATKALPMVVERFADLAALGETARRAELLALIREEFGDGPQRRQLTAERLAAWVQIARVDTDAARALGRSYEAVFAELPADLAMRRAMAVQAVIGYFPEDERSLLMDIVPGMDRHVSSRTGEVVSKRSTKECANTRSRWAKLLPGR